jgi:hypothetical protein
VISDGPDIRERNPKVAYESKKPEIANKIKCFDPLEVPNESGADSRT